MTTETELNTMIDGLVDAYAAIDEKGGTRPQYRNFASLALSINTIPQKSGPDPNNPTIPNLQEAISTGEPEKYYPVGTEIPDTFNGKSNPIIVLHYLKEKTADSNKYSGAVGAICMHKYTDTDMQTWYAMSDYGYWNPQGSYAWTYCQTDYYPKCSTALKNAMGSIKLPYSHHDKPIGQVSNISFTDSTNVFLPSTTEMGTVCGLDTETAEGVFWDYWKQKIGITTLSAFTTEYSARILRSSDGVARSMWSRTEYSTTRGVFLSATGGFNHYRMDYTDYIHPAFFIAGLTA